jgi:hypothetical protein
MILPGDASRQLEDHTPQKTSKRSRVSKPKAETETKERGISSGGLKFVIPSPEPAVGAKRKGERERRPRVKSKNDPRYVAAARELRDRWLEEVNSGRVLPEAAMKYEVSRALPNQRAGDLSARLALPEAA